MRSPLSKTSTIRLPTRSYGLDAAPDGAAAKGRQRRLDGDGLQPRAGPPQTVDAAAGGRSDPATHGFDFGQFRHEAGPRGTGTFFGPTNLRSVPGPKNEPVPSLGGYDFGVNTSTVHWKVSSGGWSFCHGRR